MQRWKRAAFPLLGMLMGCGSAQSQPCDDLPGCMQAIREQAQPRDGSRIRGMGRDDDALKEAVLAHEGAVEALVPLLADPDERVAGLAAYMLRDAPSIDPAHLPRIIEGLDRKLGWLPPALARIGTEAAAKEAVDRFLVSRSAPSNQEAYALVLLGARAIPFMLERARCDPGCADNTHYLLSAVLARMGPERAAAGPGLMRIASDRNASAQAVQGALVMIASLGREGSALEADLLREREQTPYLSRWIADALVGIHSTQAGLIFAERLAEAPDGHTLSDLAELGALGRAAGPAVVSVLEREPGLRTEAVAALGYIGYVEAMPLLVEALDDPADVRVNWTAARALGHLGSGDALPALDRAASGHWYAPVRDAAREAAKAIRTGVPAPNTEQGQGFGWEFFEFWSINRDLPQCPRHTGTPRSTRTKLYHATARGELEKLKYPAVVLSFGAADEDEQREAGKDIIEVNHGNLEERRTPIEQTPHVALRVDGGWLVGGDRGEWGGELVFVGDDGRFQEILDDNVEDIHRLGDGIVAIVGLAHMSLNDGAIMKLERAADGQWQAHRWRVLPGAPGGSVVTREGIIVPVVGGGAILVDAGGGMRMVDCPR